MGRIFGILFVLIVLGIVALLGLSFTDMVQPDQRDVVQPVTLDAR